MSSLREQGLTELRGVSITIEYKPLHMMLLHSIYTTALQKAEAFGCDGADTAVMDY